MSKGIELTAVNFQKGLAMLSPFDTIVEALTMKTLTHTTLEPFKVSSYYDSRRNKHKN